jgi:Flp pilus assembly secretin CpaC
MALLSCLRRGVFVLIAVIIVFCLLAWPRSSHAGDINVILDQARMVKLPDRVVTIVVGNPAIADATVQAGGWMVLTAKGYGLTNVIALDRTGTVVLEKTVEVRGPRSVVVVHRGVDRETLNCTPICESRVTLGDSRTVFEQSAGQIVARNAVSASSAQGR